MCGRAAYSARGLSAAAASLRGGGTSADAIPNTASYGDEKPRSDAEAQGASTNITPITLPSDEISDRPNASPGNVFHVFRRSRNAPNDPGRVECAPLIWGLLPHNGTHSSPHRLPSHPNFSPSPHYKIFNARSETVYDKPSFRGAMLEGKTCILAVDGYYEWTKSQSHSDKRKQPYFVRNEDGRPLLLAGVWTRVHTGRGHEMIETFAILTMDAHPEFGWIHPRQPVILPEGKGALEWLMRPTPQLVERLRSIPKKDTSDNTQKSVWDSLMAHPVDKKVNDGKYQGADCTVEVKLATKRSAGSIASFFSPGGGKKAKVDKKESKPGASSSETRPASSPLTGMPKRKATIAESDRHESAKEEKMSWTCSKCTYAHEGAARFGYLACEICGSPRTDN